MEEEGLQLNQAEQYLFEVLLNETCKELDFFFFFLSLPVCCLMMMLR
jgi:hypothetical protein